MGEEKTESESPMSSPYSEDLRQKALAAVERGEGKGFVA
jgi:hypothetical protein